MFATLQTIPDGKAGTLLVLEKMRKLSQEGKKQLIIRNLALQLVEGLQQKDYLGEVEALTRFVRYGIRYVKDVDEIETLQTPQVTLQVGQGDCDDKVTLLSALLNSIGHKTRFVAVGFIPGIYSHVFLEVNVRGQWIPIETTEPVDTGWVPNNLASMLIYPDLL